QDAPPVKGGPGVKPRATRFHCYEKWNFGALLALLLILVFVPNGVREPLMLMVAVVSYFFTPQRVFEANEFSWRPLIEVEWIFLGIFGTMIPVLDYVEFHASEFHLASDARFYWSTGLLIGNCPNLLIRAIAESRHVPTPGFLAYIIRYALPILIPVLGLLGLIFFRG